MGKIAELQSIALLTSHVPQAPLPYGVGDDCALIETNNSNHVVTMDSMVEGIHFDDRWKPDDVGWKLMLVMFQTLLLWVDDLLIVYVLFPYRLIKGTLGFLCFEMVLWML